MRPTRLDSNAERACAPMAGRAPLLAAFAGEAPDAAAFMHGAAATAATASISGFISSWRPSAAAFSDTSIGGGARDDFLDDMRSRADGTSMDASMLRWRQGGGR